MDSAERAAKALLSLKRIILITDGRDKVLKQIQYAMRVAILEVLGASTAAREKNAALLPRMQALISQFSITRKVLRLGHYVESFEAFWGFVKDPAPLMDGEGEPRTLARLAFLNSVLCIFNDISDDFCCLSKIGFLDKWWDRTFSPISARLWFSCILIDINGNRADYRAVDRRLATESARIGKNGDSSSSRAAALEDLARKRFWLDLSLYKLLADAAFCSVDVWPNAALYADGFGDRVQAWSALISGVLAFSKLWDKHKIV
ncbi:peroxisomal biogenesis factor 11 [Hyaloraphidium curvatum]|nr:peroxisomal biogenesis factor 11 [Hyaloraphidium curvatum]